MMKPLLLVALLADTFLLVLCTGVLKSTSYAVASATAAAYSENQSSSSVASSSASSSASSYTNVPCTTPGTPQDYCAKCPNPNEVYDPCIAPCPPRRCDVNEQLIKCAAPPKLGDKDCVAGCRCADGYYKNNSGVCVTKAECPPQCGKDEVYSECTQGNCNPKYCTDLGFPVACPRIDPKYCKKGCLCKTGYVRDKDGVCIPKYKCPSCGGDPNAVAGCGNCKKQCSDIGKGPIYCPAICYENACDCRTGLFYDINTKKCVPAEQCTPVCKVNEVYSDCINGGCQAKNCSQIGSPIACVKIDPKYCIKGCLCKDGYLRDDNGECVCEKDCKPKCIKPNEYYEPCGYDCPPNTCESINKTYPCPLQTADNCKGLCKCQKGYARNLKGECITEEQCLKCTGPNEYYSCGGACDNVCCTLKKQNQTNCPIVNIKCNEMCYCEDGYARAKNGTCIPIKDCDKECYGENEVYNECIQGDCSPKNCTELGFPISCPRVDPKCCKKGCLCKTGYTRNKYGVCIPTEQCPSCGGDPNAQSGCGVNCGRLCSNYMKKGVVCPLICKLNGCDCRKGYVYDSNTKQCVLPKDCTPVCKVNEVYSDCINGGCQAKNCSQIGSPIACVKIDPKYCIKGCLCKDGYLRDNNGECVCEKDCKPQICSGKHEVYENCTNPVCRAKTCSEVGFPLNCTDPPQCKKGCKKGCVCEDGYVRNATGTCIPIRECPSCGGDSNAQSGCGVNCGKKCEDLGNKPGPCIKICYPNACDCKDGYYYDKKKCKCVLASQCTQICSGKHEVYENCTNPVCRAKTCSEVGFPLNCTDPPQCKKGCKKGCVCEDGYVRNATGNCIPIRECPSCGGDSNAQSGCGVNCGKKCEDLGNKPGPCIKICYPNACDCKPGYYYDSKKGKCVLPSQCTQICSGKHEVYENCTNPVCRAKTCSEVGFPLNCTDLPQCKKGCKKGCVCEDGYVRNATGNCIPIRECPSCGGDINAQSGCGVNCGKNCEDIGKKPGACILICYPNACDCKPGYYYDKKQGKCVLPSQCTQICSGKHEVYENCTNPVCRAKTCSEVGFPLNCTDPPQCKKGCKKGCVCEDGYVRNATGTCIPIRECPSCGGDSNAQSGCGVNCGKKCEDLGNKPGPCIKICYPNACDCKPGYYYDSKKGKCVLPSQCTQICSGKHEVYENCTNPVCRAKTCSEVGFPLNCTDLPQCKKGCKKGCVCEDGYVRNATGTCIPIRECPSCGGDSNAQSGCGVNCGKKCEDLGNKPGTCIKICYPNACDCKPGYYYDSKKGKCVLPSQCTQICSGKHEVYENCTNPVCRAKTCSEVGFPLNCTDLPQCKKGCKKGCVCEDGYVRNATGNCIPIRECPSCGGDSNAQSGCGVNCGKKCEDLGNKPGPCIKICYPNACDCKPGYYYDSKKGKCVLPSQCTQICSGKHEVYENCTNPVCRAKTCSEVGFPLNCTDPPQCKKGCVCEDGYVRNATGNCIPIRECPSCGGDINAQSGCGVNCGKNCEDIGKKPGACILICYPNACDCKPGYYYDKKQGKCVLPSQCTQICSGKHEVYENCTNPVCRAKTCSEVGFPLNCTDPPQCKKGCKKGCVCEDGYVRNATGTCIPIRECPSCGGDSNAQSGCGVNCGKKCEDLGNKPGPCIKICYPNACDCKPGYYYDSKKGKCVLPSQCTQICSGKHEVYENCTNPVCRAKTCSEVGFPLNCTDLPQCKKGCKKGCVCEDGYVRNATGNCIPIRECPSCGGDSNAQSGCGVNCGQKCEDLGKKPGACPDICLANGCDCKPGYYYDSKKGKCVLPSQCTQICSGKHEVYENCTNPVCRAKTCSEVGFPLNCTDPPQCKKGCKKGCVCEDGYVRNATGTCIPIRECPSCGGDINAQSGCGVNCGKNCEDIGKKPGACILICYPNACDCKPGYYYDKKQGKCVLPSQCTQTCCGKREVYENCTNPVCRPKTCSEVGFPLNCTDPPQCNKGCICKDGYVRNPKGNCISIKKCPSCGGDKNATSGCGINCLRKCYDLQHPDKPKPCPKICNINSCDCKKGFYKDENTGKCVKSCDCTPTCGENEVYDICINGGCGPRNCSQVDGPILCIDPIKCIGGCTCKKDYYRLDATGVCVPKEQCPKKCKNPNEIYVQCPPTCPPQTCESINKTYHCPRILVKVNVSNCVGECRCKENYYRNLNNECISTNDCLKCTGANEYFSCGPAIDNVCFDTQRKSSKCSMQNTDCVQRCYCADGYVRDDNDVCVAIKDCPPRCV